ncbi:MAG TPA: cupin domain-containing protein [Phycisphaerae bacterium]|nr:cupin domain-containing protein [Phycisphaerae bacterium]
MNAGNIFADVPAQLPDELFEDLLKTAAVRVERIVSRGQCSPEGFWYDQDRSEWVMVLKGRARLLFDGQDSPIELRMGDYINIPSHVRHRVEWTDPEADTVWLAVHY